MGYFIFVQLNISRFFQLLTFDLFEPIGVHASLVNFSQCKEILNHVYLQTLQTKRPQKSTIDVVHHLSCMKHISVTVQKLIMQSVSI